MTFWRSLLTEPDNTTHCPVRVGAVLTVTVYHVAAFWAVVSHGVAVDSATLGAYVQHMCTLVGTTGASAGVKSVLKGDAQ